jgi:hypothetical protein
MADGGWGKAGVDELNLGLVAAGAVAQQQRQRI